MEVCCDNPGGGGWVAVYSEYRNRVRVIKEFQSAEESGPGE